MSGPIVCGVDDSRAARNAAAVAMAMSRRIDAPLVVVHVAPDEPTLVCDAASRDERRQRALDRVRALLDQIPVPAGRVADTVVHLEIGDPAERLIALAAAQGASMLVVGSRGRRALTAALLGSVSRDLLARAPCPVLVISPNALAAAAPRHHDRRLATSVVCGIDGSPASQHAAETASGLARRLNARLVLAHSYRPAITWTDDGLTRRYSSGPLIRQWEAGLRRLEAVAAELHALPRPELSLEPGDPAEELIRMATRERAEILVVGSHGQGKLEAALHGSVAGTVASSAPMPVLVVSLPTETRADRPRSDATIDSDGRPISHV